VIHFLIGSSLFIIGVLGWIFPEYQSFTSAFVFGTTGVIVAYIVRDEIRERNRLIEKSWHSKDWEGDQ
jgi:hypothetical protein